MNEQEKRAIPSGRESPTCTGSVAPGSARLHQGLEWKSHTKP